MNRLDEILENQRGWQALSADDDSALRDVALESLSICNDAIAVLSQNLKKIGYVWISSERLSPDFVEKNVQIIESKTGLPIPKILVEFWKVVGGVSFVDLKRYKHKGFWKRHKINPEYGFADGLHIEVCNDEWVSFVCDDYLDWKEYFTTGESDGFLLCLSPDGYHKDNISGGAPYGVFAKSTWKPVWQNFKWPGAVNPITGLACQPDFLSYLRTTILECAGFPALLGVPAFDPIKEKLLQGVPLF